MELNSFEKAFRAFVTSSVAASRVYNFVEPEDQEDLEEVPSCPELHPCRVELQRLKVGSLSAEETQHDIKLEHEVIGGPSAFSGDDRNNSSSPISLPRRSNPRKAARRSSASVRRTRLNINYRISDDDTSDDTSSDNEWVPEPRGSPVNVIEPPTPQAVCNPSQCSTQSAENLQLGHTYHSLPVFVRKAHEMVLHQAEQLKIREQQLQVREKQWQAHNQLQPHSLAPKRQQVQVPTQQQIHVPKLQQVQIPKQLDVQVQKQQQVHVPKLQQVQVPKQLEVQAPKQQQVQVPKQLEVQVPKQQQTQVQIQQQVQRSYEEHRRVPLYIQKAEELVKLFMRSGDQQQGVGLVRCPSASATTLPAASLPPLSVAPLIPIPAGTRRDVVPATVSLPTPVSTASGGSAVCSSTTSVNPLVSSSTHTPTNASSVTSAGAVLLPTAVSSHSVISLTGGEPVISVSTAVCDDQAPGVSPPSPESAVSTSGTVYASCGVTSTAQSNDSSSLAVPEITAQSTTTDTSPSAATSNDSNGVPQAVSVVTSESSSSAIESISSDCNATASVPPTSTTTDINSSTSSAVDGYCPSTSDAISLNSSTVSSGSSPAVQQSYQPPSVVPSSMAVYSQSAIANHDNRRSPSLVAPHRFAGAFRFPARFKPLADIYRSTAGTNRYPGHRFPTIPGTFPGGNKRVVDSSAGASEHQSKRRPVITLQKPLKPPDKLMAMADNGEGSIELNPGDYLINVFELHMEFPPIWRLNSGTLLERFEAHETPKWPKTRSYKRDKTYVSMLLTGVECFRKVKVDAFGTQRLSVVLTVDPHADDFCKVKADSLEKTAQYLANYEVFVQTFISQVLDDNFLKEVNDDQDEYFISSLAVIRKVNTRHIDKLLELKTWSEDTQKRVDNLPVTTLDLLATHSSSCSFCGRRSSPYGVRLSGDKYDPLTMKPVPDESADDNSNNNEEAINLCTVCARLLDCYSQLKHMEFNLFGVCKKRVEEQTSKFPDDESRAILTALLEDSEWVSQNFKKARSLWGDVDLMYSLLKPSSS